MLSHTEFLEARAKKTIQYRIMPWDAVSWVLTRGHFAVRLQIVFLFLAAFASLALGGWFFRQDPLLLASALAGLALGLTKAGRSVFVVGFFAICAIRAGNTVIAFANGHDFFKPVDDPNLFWLYLLIGACGSIRWLQDIAKDHFRMRVLMNANEYERAVSRGSLMLIPVAKS